VPFTNPLVAGTTLIRDAIQSPNYIAGVSGWSINKDGSAEFNDLTVRGELFVTGDDGSQISIEKVNNNGSMQPFIFLTPANPTANGLSYSPAEIYAIESFPGDTQLELSIESPSPIFATRKSSILRLYSENDTGSAKQHIDMFSRVHVRDMSGQNGDLQVDGSLSVGNHINGSFYKTVVSDTDGSINFGSGTAAQDTNLYRSAANVLKTDDAFVATGGVNNGFVFQDSITFTSTGTFTKASFPSATMARVRLVGGGGGGGGCAANAAGNNSTAGGGGGGAYAESWLNISSFGASETVTVGAAGSAGAVAGNGGTGGTSSLGTFISANGGNGGAGGGTSTTWFWVPGGAAQATATGDITIPGGPGFAGSRNGASYVAGQQMGGNGGNSQLGSGGQGSNNANGSAGNNYGAGGGGASAPQSAGGFTGGAGSKGIVIVDLYG